MEVYIHVASFLLSNESKVCWEFTNWCVGYPIQGSKSSLFAEMDFFLVCTYVGCVCLGSVLIIYLSDLSSCLVCKHLCLHYLQYYSHNTPPPTIPSSPIFSSFPLFPPPSPTFLHSPCWRSHSIPLSSFPLPLCLNGFMVYTWLRAIATYLWLWLHLIAWIIGMEVFD